ncbi:3-carboxyethylcatechol 2,3-dioxygenase [Pseudonocardia broussonetiae]|uniref:2,3-dihydroxyphenylpropionate/2,3-dihydroxicinnamic acid 1,2-dioxygenase n=1 Tax=Pseudonocardia broussonetiae TaxID=2736640 RepID=A0A6M6JJS0_9PSEU|nr:3-carboxyethylcatechol 2,3-dioxygenase [Pseudonocardia broussonetiae]QJY47455.1 3-carboxyethylcatechol 2,3-dioxygenase [Pseudonocardia broussonetiae]
MPLAVCTTSHSPLMGENDPAPEVAAAVEEAFADARAFVADFAPDLVLLLGPDHYNGFFYDMMPPFCLGTGATSVGDYRTAAGPLPVDRDAAYALVRHVLAEGLDLAYSERMFVDHGLAQPLEILFGGLDAVPLVPVFINSVAEPLGPMSRVRRLGEALGRAAAALDRRVLVLGSGGLSHDPPVPRLDGAPPAVAERLIAGRHPTAAQRAEHEQRVYAAGRAFAAGTSTIAPLNPEWDRRLMALLAAGELDEIDTWTPEEFVEQAGHSSHEVRTWIAAYAALSTAGPYEVRSSFYRPVPEWIAGFGITTAATAAVT